MSPRKRARWCWPGSRSCRFEAHVAGGHQRHLPARSRQLPLPRDLTRAPQTCQGVGALGLLCYFFIRDESPHAARTHAGHEAGGWVGGRARLPSRARLGLPSARQERPVHTEGAGRLFSTSSSRGHKGTRGRADHIVANARLLTANACIRTVWDRPALSRLVRKGVAHPTTRQVGRRQRMSLLISLRPPLPSSFGKQNPTRSEDTALPGGGS